MTSENVPVLAQERMDYTEGAYHAEVKRMPNGMGVQIAHSVSGSNLVSDLLKQSKAAFAAEVASPYATYRQLRLSVAEAEIHFTQEVTWEAQDVVPPVYIRPLVVAIGAQPSCITLESGHGVHEIWWQESVEIVRGTILASGPFWRGASTWQSLIRLTVNDDLAEGTYRVNISTGEGGYFEVQMHRNLFHRMVNPGDERRHRNSILTGCLSRGLEMVQKEYGDGSWQESPVLRALHAKLVENGLETWEDEEDFRPDEVATRLRPIVFGASHDG